MTLYHILLIEGWINTCVYMSVSALSVTFIITGSGIGYRVQNLDNIAFIFALIPLGKDMNLYFLPPSMRN